jgi:hypothetical protein
VVESCGKLKSKELRNARKKVIESGYKEGIAELIALREKISNSKCILIDKCTRCPSCVSAMPPICAKMNRQIDKKDEIPEWCPLELFDEIERAYRGGRR